MTLPFNVEELAIARHRAEAHREDMRPDAPAFRYLATIDDLLAQLRELDGHIAELNRKALEREAKLSAIIEAIRGLYVRNVPEKGYLIMTPGSYQELCEAAL